MNKKEDSYEITLLKGNVPNKRNVTFTSEALANAAENYNKTHKDSRLFINAEVNLAMTTRSYSKLLEKKEMEELMKSFDMSEIENRTATMYERACEIRDLADSEYASDAHLLEMSEKFKADFGCHWTEILN